MPKEWKKSLVEMTVIIAVAVTVGVLWNHRILIDVFTGRHPASKSPPTASAAPGKSLLPAGLLQVKDLYDNNQAVFIDARDGADFAKERIRRSISIPLAEADVRLAGFMAKHPPATPVVIYCNGYGCHDSKTLGEKLLKKGYQQVLVFEGGFPEWKDAGFPIEGAAQ